MNSFDVFVIKGFTVYKIKCYIYLYKIPACYLNQIIRKQTLKYLNYDKYRIFLSVSYFKMK